MSWNDFGVLAATNFVICLPLSPFTRLTHLCFVCWGIVVCHGADTNRRRNAQMLALQESQERDQRRRLELEAEATLRRQTSVTRTNLNVVVVYKSERQAFAVAPVRCCALCFCVPWNGAEGVLVILSCVRARWAHWLACLPSGEDSIQLLGQKT